jgi:hypothetical protein
MCGPASPSSGRAGDFEKYFINGGKPYMRQVKLKDERII